MNYVRVLFSLTVVILVQIQSVISQEYIPNESDSLQSLADSPETVDYMRDRFVPRFNLDRPRDRYTHLHTQYFNKVDSPHDTNQNRLFEADATSIRPLTWHDFPQLIHDKLATVSYLAGTESPVTVSSLPTETTVSKSNISNYSSIVPKFPIYFTNPTTGAVYAITEVKSPGNESESDSTKVFSDGSTKSYEHGNDRYTLQCTMVEAFGRPIKKTSGLKFPLLPRTTTRRPKTKKKNKKNAAKRRNAMTTESPFHTSIISNPVTEKVFIKLNPITKIIKPPINTRKTTQLPNIYMKPTVHMPSSMAFSKKRKLTKRMVPPTAPTSSDLISNSTNQTATKPPSDDGDDSYYLSLEDFSFPESLYDDESTSSENKETQVKRKIPKRNKKNLKTTKTRRKLKKKTDDSESASVEVMDYVNDFISPIKDAFETISERTKGIFGSDGKEKPVALQSQSGKPIYTIYNADSLKNKSGSSWLGSWFSTGDGSNEDQIIKPTTATVSSEPGWFDYWYGDEDYADKTTTEAPDDSESTGSRWFFNWFGSDPQTTPKPTTTSTTTTTTTTPQPFLSIIDPVKKAPEWFGMLAQNIIGTTPNQKSTPAPNLEDEGPREISYNGYQIWRLHMRNHNDVKTIEEYKSSPEGAELQWLAGPSLRGPTDVIVPPKLTTNFLGTLNYEGIKHETMIFDLGKAIQYESSNTVQSILPNNKIYPLTWTRYYRYDDIIGFLEFAQLKHPNLVELIHVGRSYEGRPIVIAKIGHNTQGKKLSKDKTKKRKKLDKNKKEVFIEAGTHGREWIGPATATWIIKELIRLMRSNSTINDPIRNTAWYVLPVLNPDGYEYTHEYDRFWRKSRSRHISRPSGIIDSAMAWLQNDNKEKICYGVDLNRNWNYQWGRKGSSRSPCNELYSGPKAFSEPETRAVSKFLMDYRRSIKLFISLHAYGQIISFPNSVNTSYGSQKIDDMIEVALVAMERLRKLGSRNRYRTNAGNDLKEIRSGTSDQFSLYEASIPFSYSIDLSDDGVHGFLLPGSFIESTAKDAFEMIKSMLNYI